MDLKPVILDFVCHPEIVKIEEKFGPVVVQVLPKIRAQNQTSLRMTLSDGKYQISGVYQRTTPISEDFFTEGQLIEIREYQMLLSQGRPYIYFLSFEPKGIAPATQPEKLTTSLFASMRESKGLPTGAAATGAAPAAAAPAAAPAPARAAAAASAPAAAAPRPKPKGVVGIEAVSPFIAQWKIRARCMQKGDIVTYKRGEKEGKLFNVTFVDESGEIRATAFNEDVDKWYTKLQENQIYLVSGLKVNSANKRFNTTNNDFELIFQRSTEIEQTEGDDSVPKVKLSLTPLDKLASADTGSNVDVLGIVTSVGDVSSITSRTGQSFEKRAISIVDRSSTSVEVTLWGADAQNFVGRVAEPVEIKAAKIGEYMGARNLSIQRSSMLIVNPHDHDSIALKAWYDAEGTKTSFTKLKAQDKPEGERQKMEIDLIKDALTRNDNEYFTIRGVVDGVLSRTIYYPACAMENCLKKAVNTTDGEWRCESCDKSFPKPNYRYILNIIVLDGALSPGMRVSVFDEVAKELLGIDANQLAELREVDEESPEVKDILKRPIGGEYYFRLQSKLDSYQGQENMRFRCMKLMPIHWNKATSELLDEL